MNRLAPVLLPALLVALLGAPGCSDDAGTPPTPDLDNPGGFFVEPTGVCLADTSGGDSLAVFNLGDTTLVVTVVHHPATGFSGLPAEITLAPLTGRILGWSWNPGGPYPVADSLVLEANDSRRARVVVPVLRREPGTVGGDFQTPAPLLASPADDAVFAVPDEVPLFWSRHTGCGPVTYTVELSEEADFSPSLRQANLPDPGAVVELEPGDEGLTLHWRARTTAGGITGAWSEPRRFHVEPSGRTIVRASRPWPTPPGGSWGRR